MGNWTGGDRTGGDRGPGVEQLNGQAVLVTGARVAGLAAAAALRELGARVSVADANPELAERAVELGFVAAPDPEQTARRSRLVVTSPGYRPDSAVLLAAAAAGVPVWGDVELAWRCDVAESFGPRCRWLAVTGTNGKTTTTTMLASVLRAAGRAALACGNVGLPVLDALRAAERPTELAAERPTELAVELSSFQLHWAPSVRPFAGAVLNLAEDHLDWHGSMDAYAAAKARVLTGQVAVRGLDDAAATALPATAVRSVGFRLGEPGAGETGWYRDRLVERGAAVTELATAGDLALDSPPARLNAAAAATLARAAGVPAGAVAAGLRAHPLGEHRGGVVAVVDGVSYVDDSKATNPHAALASLSAHPRVVWVAGGLLKGASVDALVAAAAPRLQGVVLIGTERRPLAAALARHAPEVPVVEVPAGDDAAMAETVMERAVGAAAAMAGPGGTVLLAPAAASMDQFRDYAHRGRAFAAAAAARARSGSDS